MFLYCFVNVWVGIHGKLQIFFIYSFQLTSDFYCFSYVFDETDHVWAEVYSFSQKRWLHCDPCENVCDTPLIYETGWNKQLSYIIAYSAEEVQDVTWRYSARHFDLLKRRNKCSEDELIEALIKLREERQMSLTEARRNYLTKRLVEELVELMQEKKAGKEDDKGRVSGSLGWRLARGETQIDDNGHEKYVWFLSANENILRYSASLDQYEFVGNNDVTIIKNWCAGVFEHKGVFRKEERDWKMVYLARRGINYQKYICIFVYLYISLVITEDEDEGFIKWKFAINKNTKKCINTVEVNLDYAIYENGVVKTTIETNNETILQLCKWFCTLCGSYLEILFVATGNTKTDILNGAKSFEIVARLSGGRGDVAWQHAQLFRQTLGSSNYNFIVNITLKDG